MRKPIIFLALTLFLANIITADVITAGMTTADIIAADVIAAGVVTIADVLMLLPQLMAETWWWLYAAQV